MYANALGMALHPVSLTLSITGCNVMILWSCNRKVSYESLGISSSSPSYLDSANRKDQPCHAGLFCYNDVEVTMCHRQKTT
jgi:hypothetical protein